MSIDLTRSFYKAVKEQSSCLICDTDRNVQFHHVDPSKKVSEVGKIAMFGDPESLVAELNKCVTLCEKHHQYVHGGMINGWLKGRFNNGKISNDNIAIQFMPIIGGKDDISQLLDSWGWDRRDIRVYLGRLREWDDICAPV
jgi:hypothetical protein